MTRVNHSVQSRNKHKKILKQAKGYYSARSKNFKSAKQSVIKSCQYSYIHRKVKKRDFRKTWIIKINAELKKNNLSYNNFIFLLKNKKININKKILSYIAEFKQNDFKKIINYIIK
ncbi:50S ribosomal protein L20 [endosymbiont of Euscepes postfasciatus]|uniref:50S ribosomal protein L20 n=1 Tax=endosymbiont of Euscepes postfasciatus TaxID=650377 RepID=UPI000DC736DD|nr:50S ribosomal protein L20 [endosymbiont of Euscepes postfasciatus]BBA84661.1 50S ribosomal protein L20 [endosymbiont of Euscepes postfasciatus]